VHEFVFTVSEQFPLGALVGRLWACRSRRRFSRLCSCTVRRLARLADQALTPLHAASLKSGGSVWKLGALGFHYASPYSPDAQWCGSCLWVPMVSVLLETFPISLLRGCHWSDRSLHALLTVVRLNESIRNTRIADKQLSASSDTLRVSPSRIRGNAFATYTLPRPTIL
jgi:hypothetical protein